MSLWPPSCPASEPPWLLFSGSKLVLAQLLAYAGYHLHKAIEGANTDSSFKRLKKRTLYGLIGAFELAAVSNFLSDIIFFARKTNRASIQHNTSVVCSVAASVSLLHSPFPSFPSFPPISLPRPRLRWRLWQPAQRLLHCGAAPSAAIDPHAAHLGAAILFAPRCKKNGASGGESRRLCHLLLG